MSQVKRADAAMEEAATLPKTLYAKLDDTAPADDCFLADVDIGTFAEINELAIVGVYKLVEVRQVMGQVESAVLLTSEDIEARSTDKQES